VSRLVRAAGVACVALAAAPALAHAQFTGSIGLSATSVRFADGTRLGSMTLAPSLDVTTARLSGVLGGALTTMPLGGVATTGRADVWVATDRTAGGLRLAAHVSGGAMSRPDIRTGVLHTIGEVVWDRDAWGIAAGMGPATGWIAGEPSVTALHTRVRAWRSIRAGTATVTIEPTRWLGAWFTDVTMQLAAARGPVTLALSGAVRRAESGTSTAGGAALSVFAGSSVALELAAGSALRDPYQGLPRVVYASAGVRLYRGALAARRARSAAATPVPAPAPAPLTVQRRGGSAVIRFRMDGAASVAIAGSWNGWRATPLVPQGDYVFEAALALPPGSHEFTLLVDGREWVVPEGIAVRRDAAGGLVALLVVR
jgi:hypothetical protein